MGFGVVVVSSLTPVYRQEISFTPAEEFDPPEEAYWVQDYNTHDWTCYAPGLEPFQVPSYFTSGGKYWRFVYTVEGDSVSVSSVPVDAGDLPEVYYDNYNLEGEIPPEYAAGADNIYYYDGLTDSYGAETQVIYAYQGLISSTLYA